MSRDPYRSSTGAIDRTADERWERESYTRQRGRPDPRDEAYAHGALPVRGSPVATTRAPPAVPPPAPKASMPYPDDRTEFVDHRPYYPRERDEISEQYYEKDRRYTRRVSPSPPPAAGRVPRPGMLRRQSSLDTFDRPPPRMHERDDYGAYPPRRDGYRPAPGPPPAPYIPEPIPPRSHRIPPPEVAAAAPRREFWDDAHPSRRPAYEEPLYRGALEPYRGPPPMSAPPVRRSFHDDIHVNEPGYYGDDDWHPYQEREIVHERRSTRRRHRGRSHSRSRSHSRDSHTTTTKSHTTTTTSRSSSTSSGSSSSSGGTTVKSEYPKKGKTRIPARLVSKRALYDLGYPFEEDGTTIVVNLALGQQNIDDLLKLSEDYKKAEVEVETAQVVEEPKALPAPPLTTVIAAPAPAATTTVVVEQPPAPGPVVIAAEPNPDVIEILPPGAPVEVIENRKVTHSHSHHYDRDVSPARTYMTGTTGTSDYTYTTTTSDPVDRLLESEHTHIGPLVLAKDSHRRRKSKSRSRSRSHHRGERAISARIRELEAERHAIRHGRRHGRSRHRAGSVGDDGVVRYHERLSNGDLIVYEEHREEFSDDDAHHHHSHSHSRSRHSHSRARSKSRGPRIERDKSGPPPRLLRAMLATLT